MRFSSQAESFQNIVKYVEWPPLTLHAVYAKYFLKNAFLLIGIKIVYEIFNQ